ncbi:MAG: LysE family translocator [Woeseiaceae bacterium]|nr:LysE family translocator [Woeseiaceae bacterium]
METLVALVVATAVLVSIPGPNVALIVATSLRDGRAAGIRTVAGTTLGVAVQLGFVIVGLTSLLRHAAGVLGVVKWAGVAYLIAVGIRTWREAASIPASPPRAPAAFWRGFGIAAVNPKTLLFNAAFLPQFVPATADVGHVTVVAALFLAVLFAGDCLWVLCAVSARRVLGRAAGIANRLSGAFLVAAGIGLAVARRTSA